VRTNGEGGWERAAGRARVIVHVPVCNNSWITSKIPIRDLKCRLLTTLQDRPRVSELK